MRLGCLLVLLSVAAPVVAQPQTPPAERRLGRIGVGVGSAGASGLSLYSPNVSYGVPCYSSHPTGPYYECGSYAVAFLVDGEYEYDVLTSHTLFFSPSSSVDPYLTGYMGFGYGDEFGFAWGAEVGVNVWLVSEGGITIYRGFVRGDSQRYQRIGVGLVFDMGD
ncbi:MAG: hypothetical protein AAF791_07155 [Bacteroidota bacterium]